MESPILSEDLIANYTPIIDAIFQSSDLSTVSVKKVRNGLSAQTGEDFSVIKKQIDSLITARFDKILAEQSEPPEASESSEEEKKPVIKKRKSSAVTDEDARIAAELHAALNGSRPSRNGAKAKKPVAAMKKKRARKSKATVDSDGEDGTPVKKKRAPNPNNAFMRPLILAQPLAEFVGETQLSRPGVVKAIWTYIKAHDLQDPNDKRYIICDDRMKVLFGDKVHMFTMNKVLSGMLYKPEEVSETLANGVVVKTEVKDEPSDESSEA